MTIFGPLRTAAVPWPSRFWPLLVLLTLLLLILFPSLNLGFVSDDYANLVEATATLPLTSSFDGLHRPLRNILFKVSYLTFGLHSIPYHLGLILLHLSAVTALWRCMLHLSGNRHAAIVAATLFGFFPRNHQTLFGSRRDRTVPSRFVS